jgi:hypothetical protein
MSHADSSLTNPKNLIPLVFVRPLRLFVPAEKLRNTRIMLLKVTHLPIVGAIWLFESIHERVGGASTWSSIGPSSASMTIDSTTGTKKQRPFLSNRTNSKVASMHFPDTPGEDGGSDDREHMVVKGKKEGKTSNDKGGVVMVNNLELEDKVADLSAKIAELTALIMAQQGTSQEE